MNSKRKILAAALIGVAGLLSPMVQAGGDHGRGHSGGGVKLEGAWVAKVPLGEPPAPQLQWSYVLSPDSSGRRASLHGSIDVGLGVQSLFTETIIGISPLIGELVMTGPHSGRFNSVWYVLGADTSGYGLTAKILAIGVNKGEWKSIGPGKTQVGRC